jgi:hypothetical protein
MKLRTTLFLLLLLIGLAAVVKWQLRTEDQVHEVDLRLFAGVELEAVRTIRVDNIERSLNVRFERDSAGEWYITDPIRYPARRAVMDLLTQDIATAKALVVSEAEWGEEELGFDPPKIVMEVDEVTEAGVVTTRVEIGAKDLDGVRVNVRVNGRYLRALMRLYTTLSRDLHGFRSRRAISLPLADIVEVHRTGSVLYEIDGEAEDLLTHAFRIGDSWRSTHPFDAQLDPLDIGVLVFGTGGLRIDRFVEDDAVDLSEYALDRPLVEIELVTNASVRETLLLSRIGNSSRWFAMRKGEPFVWAIEPEKAGRLLFPFEGMLERHFMRATRQDVTGVRLTRPGGMIRLDRGLRGWQVAEKRGGGTWSSPSPADPRAVEDLLARLESLEVSRFFVDEPAPPTDWERGVEVEVGGALFGGRLGAAFTDEEGNTGVLFRRDGDDVIGWIDPWLAEAAEMDLDLLRSTHLSTVEEVELSGLTLIRGEQRLAFGRDRRGIWRQEGEDREAVELLMLLDPLLFLRAGEHLGGDGNLNDPIAVEFRRFNGSTVTFTVGLGTAADGTSRSEIAIGAARSTAKVGDLHAQLVQLFPR